VGAGQGEGVAAVCPGQREIANVPTWGLRRIDSSSWQCRRSGRINAPYRGEHGNNPILVHHGPERVVKAADASEPDPIFKWDSLREICPHELQHQGRPVPGKSCEIGLTSGRVVRVWRSDDSRQYFCHGLTFGGKEGPAGAVSPYTGEPVEAILQEYFVTVPEGQSRAGDILVWRGIAPETTPHSAILMDAVIAQGKSYLDDEARIRTKNGLSAEAEVTLEQLVAIYGESYSTYRRR
jgi:hypothetical protein